MTAGTLEFGTLRFGESDQGWALAEGSGDRYIDVEVEAPTEADPALPIALALTGMDCGGQVRVKTEVVAQDATSFIVRIWTWYDTVLAGLAVAWARS